MPKKAIFSYSCILGMTLDYKHREIGSHSLFGRSTVLTLQKNWFFVLFWLSYLLTHYPLLCAIPCSNFLGTILFWTSKHVCNWKSKQKKCPLVEWEPIRTLTTTKAKTSMFVICVEAIIYFSLYKLQDCTFKF